MKPPSPSTEKNPARDLETFEQLPAKTKEWAILKDGLEKATGHEKVILHKKIQTKAKKGTPSAAGTPG